MIFLAYIDLGLALIAVLWTCVTTVSTGIRRPWMIWLLALAAWQLFVGAAQRLGPVEQWILLINSLLTLGLWWAICLLDHPDRRATRHVLEADGQIVLAEAALALRDAGCDDEWLQEYVALGLDSDRHLGWAAFRKQQRDVQSRRRIRMTPAKRPTRQWWDE